MTTAASPRVTIVDYGVGNLLSVSRAVEAVGAVPELCSDPDGVAAAERLILPGVGAFGNGMDGLRARGLVEPLRAFAASGRPFLGICLGMQLMFERSHEFGLHDGLGLIPGEVVPIPATAADGTPHKVPHVGWSGLVADRAWDGTLLDGRGEGEATYFVHSFMAAPADPADRLAHCLYDGRPLAAVVERGMLAGCQFHPEKSGPVGLAILTTFVRR